MSEWVNVVSGCGRGRRYKSELASLDLLPPVIGRSWDRIVPERARMAHSALQSHCSLHCTGTGIPIDLHLILGRQSSGPWATSVLSSTFEYLCLPGACMSKELDDSSALT